MMGFMGGEGFAVLEAKEDKILASWALGAIPVSLMEMMMHGRELLIIHLGPCRLEAPTHQQIAMAVEGRCFLFW